MRSLEHTLFQMFRKEKTPERPILNEIYGVKKREIVSEKKNPYTPGTEDHKDWNKSNGVDSRKSKHNPYAPGTEDHKDWNSNFDYHKKKGENSLTKFLSPHIKEETINEEVLEEAKSKYYVSVNYSKGYGGDAEHAVKHYTTPRPNVPDNHISSILTHHVRENVPQHKEMIKKGWRTSDLGMVGSHEQKYAKNEAEERHARSMATTKMIKDNRGKAVPSMYEEKEENKEVIDEGIKEKITGAIRREKAKDIPLLQSRSDYAWSKAADKYSSKDKKNGDRYWKFYKKLGGTHNKVQEAVEQNKKRLDTVKKIKAGGKNNQIEINPTIDIPKDATEV